MYEDDTVHDELRRRFESETSALVQDLRHMAQHVDARVTQFKKAIDAPPSAPHHKRHRKKLLQDLTEGVKSGEASYNTMCRQLEEEEPLGVFRQRIQACQNSDQQHLNGLLDHLQGLGLDLDAIPSVTRWRDGEQQHGLPSCASAEDLNSQVTKTFEGSPLAQHSSRSVFDVAHSPAMGVVHSGFSARTGHGLGSACGSKAYSTDENQPLQTGLTTKTPAGTTPRAKNWAVLQQQNEKLAAILAQHDIKLNTGGF